METLTPKDVEQLKDSADAFEAEQIKVKKSKGTKPGCQFDVYYNCLRREAKEEKRGLVANQLKRKFSSALDDTIDEIANVNLQIEDLRAQVEDFDIVEVVNLKLRIVQAKLIQSEIKAEYLAMFGKELSERVD